MRPFRLENPKSPECNALWDTNDREMQVSVTSLSVCAVKPPDNHINNPEVNLINLHVSDPNLSEFKLRPSSPKMIEAAGRVEDRFPFKKVLRWPAQDM